jgi:HPt (histidine-containing phosphotransfer) domain-containing protein
MTSAGDPAIQALIDAARADFARSVLAKARALEAHAKSGAWTDARREAHKLHGSAGVHGFAELGATAARLEDLFASVDEDDPRAGSGALPGGSDPSGLPGGGLPERLRDLLAEAERIARGFL